MSAYDNVIAGKLRLKGKALDVKSSGIKKKKKHKNQYDLVSQVTGNNQPKNLKVSFFCSLGIMSFFLLSFEN